MRLVHRTGKSGLVLFLAVLIFLVAAAGQVWAHKVYLFAWVENDKIMVEAYFSKSRKVQGGIIRVLDPDGKQLLEGKTDDKGLVIFPIPQKTDLSFVLDAGMGHANEFKLAADEIPDIGGGGIPSKDKQDSPKQSAPETSASETRPPSLPSPTVAMDPDRIRMAMDQALDEKLKPIQNSMAALQRSLADMKNVDQEPGFKEIFAGLGWIFGIMGLALYFRSRRQG